MNNKHQKFTYAIKNDKLVYIEDVARGLDCNCICPACMGKLIARKGNKNSHHFAHHSADCGKGYETSLHLLAKEILSEVNEIIIPPVYIETDSYYRNIELFPETKINIDHIELEKRIDNIIPDIIVTSGNRQLIIEIKVTHKVDDEKREKIKNIDISTLEIDLSRHDRLISKSELKDILVNSNINKKWLYNNMKEKYLKALYDFSEEKPVISGVYYHIDFCPIYERTYAYYVDECLYCKYLIKINYNKFGNPKSILCSGKNEILTKEDLIQTIKKYCK